MGIRDDEGLIFQEIRKKVLNEGEKSPPQKADAPKNEVTNHIKISLRSSFKLGLGMILGCALGLLIVSAILAIIGYALISITGTSFLAGIPPTI